MQRSQRAVAKQLFQARALEDAVRSAQGQRRAGDPGDGFADHVFCAVESSGGFRCRPLGIAEPSRTVGDQPGGFEVDADLGDVAPHIGVVGQRLGIAFGLPGVGDPPQLVVSCGGEAEIDSRDEAQNQFR